MLDPAAEMEKARGRAPQPPAEEWERRLAAVRAGLEAHELDAMLVFGSAATNSEPIRYLSNYVNVFPPASALLLITADADPLLLIDQDWHLSEARAMSWIEDVRPFPAITKRWLADELEAILKAALSAAGVLDGRIGTFDTHMPAAYQAVLASVAPNATFRSAAPIWQDLVANPSPYDREMIERTARIADEGLRAVVEAAKAGEREHDICLHSLNAMAAQGAEFLHGSGVSTHINIGAHSEAISNVRPFLFTTAKLEAGQMFWVDLSASYAGYFIDTDRTLCVGEPNQEQQALYATVKEMYGAMAAATRPGMTGGELWQVGNAIVKDAGLEKNSNLVYLGHTTGITTSTRPVVAEGEEREIKEGSYLNIEPGVFVPGVGSTCIEDALAIDGGGGSPVNAFPTDLHVV